MHQNLCSFLRVVLLFAAVPALASPTVKIPNCHESRVVAGYGHHMLGQYRYSIAPTGLPLRDLRQNPKLRFAAINPLFLFETGVKYRRNPLTGYTEPVPQTGEFDRKSPEDIEHLILTVKDFNADLMTMPEVENEGAMELLVQTVGIDYHTIFVKGNTSDMGMGIFIKKDLPFVVDYWSHDQLPFHGQVNGKQVSYPRAFSRDAGMVVLWHANPETGEILEQIPPMIVFAIHKKSMRSARDDYRSQKKATAESHVLRDILLAVKRAFPGSPILMGGDFNRFIPDDRTLQPIFDDTGMKDAFQHLSDRDPTLAKQLFKTTHYYFERSGEKSFHQLDGWMLNGPASQLIDRAHPKPVWVPRWRVVKNGTLTEEEIPDPESYQERDEKLPSDHNPVLIHLDVSHQYPRLILP